MASEVEGAALRSICRGVLSLRWVVLRRFKNNASKSGDFKASPPKVRSGETQDRCQPCWLRRRSRGGGCESQSAGRASAARGFKSGANSGLRTCGDALWTAALSWRPLRGDSWGQASACPAALWDQKDLLKSRSYHQWQIRQHLVSVRMPHNNVYIVMQNSQPETFSLRLHCSMFFQDLI